jgi:hypothetical protein
MSHVSCINYGLQVSTVLVTQKCTLTLYEIIGLVSTDWLRRVEQGEKWEELR